MAEEEKSSIVGNIIGGLFGLGILVAVVFGIYRAANPGPSPHVEGPAWNSAMLMGSAEAPNKIVEYSDYFCSHCAVFHHAAGEEFQKDYVDTKKVSFEMRMVNLLENVSENTLTGNNSAYCSADQGKFWEYTHEIILQIEKDYFDKQIGLGPGYPPIEKLPFSYFAKAAETAKLNAREFETCVTTEKFKDEIARNTQKAIDMGVTGLPQINVNNFQTSGFQGGYSELKTIMKAGGVK